MTRGRKKDLTIPATRALVQQRDYRARKAHYVAELEERVRKAEAENVQLRKDLEAARAGLPIPATPLNPQIAEASRDLMHHLSLATSSLDRFQHIMFPDRTYPTTLPPLQLPPRSGLSIQGRPASFPSPAPSPPFSQANPPSPSRTVIPAPTPSFSTPSASLSSSYYYSSGRKRLYREDSPEPAEPSRFVRDASPRPGSSQGSISPESECCGGILDCRDLIEEDRDNEDRDQPSSRLSVMRSTSEQSYGREDDFQHSD
ncbi:hypothetical protein D9756_007439 [Leucocoprinus leucothites]|uniref:BZIP domain-containing protein n=1 Tax=Leucocoprinus leucothites TaxID=201217 RepID=A0A8H5FX39_9AGAR|nr:hypothetical protein D9756_007439 [Leucoagaricus leucothites]